MSWTTVELCFDSRQGKAFLLLSDAHRPDLGPTLPHIQGVEELFHWGVNRPGREPFY